MRLFRERMYFCQSLLTKKIKRIMKELVEKIAALVADFNKDANAQIENGNKQQEPVLVKLHWKLKKQ